MDLWSLDSDAVLQMTLADGEILQIGLELFIVAAQSKRGKSFTFRTALSPKGSEVILIITDEYLEKLVEPLCTQLHAVKSRKKTKLLQSNNKSTLPCKL